MSLHHIGRRYVEIMEQYRRTMIFGFTVRDESRGRVIAGPGGRPVVLYQVGPRDMAQLACGLRVIIDLLFRGGADVVLPGLSFADEVLPSVGSRVLDGRALRSTDIDLQAFHPLGTARMGADPSSSVVDMDLRVRGAEDWLVCDGSVVPGSLGVNPQVTIMSLALRAAGRLADRMGL
jgi:choline dehydrogenase-like flavoprotein